MSNRRVGKPERPFLDDSRALSVGQLSRTERPVWVKAAAQPGRTAARLPRPAVRLYSVRMTASEAERHSQTSCLRYRWPARHGPWLVEYLCL